MKHREAEVIAGPAVEPHSIAVLARHDPEAVVLDLMQPPLAGRRLQGFGRKTGSDEAAHDRIYAPSRVSRLPKIDKFNEPAA